MRGVLRRFTSSVVEGEVSAQSRFPFSGARTGQFFQDGPQLGNQYEMDYPLKSYLKRVMPAEVNALHTYLMTI